MGVICIDRNTTAVDILQVAIKYTFDLAVRNVRGQIASIFFTGVHMLKPQLSIFLKLIEFAIYLSIYLLILSRSISDHHLRCGVGG